MAPISLNCNTGAGFDACTTPVAVGTLTDVYVRDTTTNGCIAVVPLSTFASQFPDAQFLGSGINTTTTPGNTIGDVCTDVNGVWNYWDGTAWQIIQTNAIPQYPTVPTGNSGPTIVVGSTIYYWNPTTNSYFPRGGDDSLDFIFDKGTFLPGDYPNYGDPTLVEKNYRVQMSPWYTTMHVYQITLELHDLSSSAITVDIKKNGTTFATLTLASALQSLSIPTNMTFITGDEITLTIVGGDATVGAVIQIFNTNS